ncbi:MAG: phosphomannomutase [Methylotenera sp.]|nr:phosphomannomutase [Methylotenera sp.]MDP1960545.1 phosphomannomutase [Methylotenera sp.]
MTNKKMYIGTLMDSTGVRFGTSGARGLVEYMSDDVCYAYAAAFLQEVVGKVGAVGNVVLGHDLRPSSPRIAGACATAIINAGGRVIYAGALPTPALASYARLHNAAAIVVTGSHIPFDRNGIKFYRIEGEISKADEVVIQQAVVEVPDHLIALPLPALDKGAEAHYIKRYTDFFGAGKLKGVRVASYEHSSVARDLLRTILEALGAEVISLGRTESFVPIDTEAVRPEDIAQAHKWAKMHAFDAVFSTDGDADRPLIGDELGQWLRGDVVGILCAKFLAADVVVTPVSSNSLTEKSGWFSKVIRTRIGSPYVIAAMEQENLKSSDVVVGFEANGGFLLGSNVVRNNKSLSALPTRDAVLPMLAVLCLAREMGCKISELPSILPGRFTASNRLQKISFAQSARLLDLLQHDNQQASEIMAPKSGEIIEVDLTDGFRVTFSNGDIVHLRPSGNAPELRCYAESDAQVKAQSLCDDCLQCVKAI